MKMLANRKLSIIVFVIIFLFPESTTAAPIFRSKDRLIQERSINLSKAMHTSSVYFGRMLINLEENSYKDAADNRVRAIDSLKIAAGLSKELEVIIPNQPIITKSFNQQTNENIEFFYNTLENLKFERSIGTQKDLAIAISFLINSYHEELNKATIEIGSGIGFDNEEQINNIVQLKKMKIRLELSGLIVALIWQIN